MELDGVVGTSLADLFAHHGIQAIPAEFMAT
jgi:hypothetical protein